MPKWKKLSQVRKKVETNMETIYLAGYHGVGKTMVGKLIASRKDIKYLDTDQIIEKNENKNVRDIIINKGIEYYTDLEKSILKNNVEQGMIVSLPADLTIDDECRRLIKTSGRVIYLRAKSDTILDHISNDNTKKNDIDNISVFTIEKDLEKLKPYYEDLANYIIDVDNKKLNNVFMEALAIYNFANKVKCHIFIK